MTSTSLNRSVYYRPKLPVRPSKYLHRRHFALLLRVGTASGSASSTITTPGLLNTAFLNVTRLCLSGDGNRRDFLFSPRKPMSRNRTIKAVSLLFKVKLVFSKKVEKFIRGSCYLIGQTTHDASLSIYGLIDEIVERQPQIIRLGSPRTNMVSTGTMPKTPVKMTSFATMPRTPPGMKSTGTMPTTPTMVSTGTMPETPRMVSTGTMPRTPTGMKSTGTMPRTPTMASTGTMPETPRMVSTGTIPRTPTGMKSTGTMPTTPSRAPSTSLSAFNHGTIVLPSSTPSTIDLVSPTVETIDLCSPSTPTNPGNPNGSPN